jgi:hypothetical protein
MSVSAIKKRALKRYHLSSHRETFVIGIGCLFGFAQSPLDGAVERIMSIDVREALITDGKMVAEDCHEVYVHITDPVIDSVNGETK